MKGQPMHALKSPSRATAQFVAVIFLTSMAVLASLDSACAQTAPKEQEQVTVVDVRGQKIPEGPHCIYTNWANLQVRESGGHLIIKTRLNGRPTTMLADTGRLRIPYWLFRKRKISA